MFRDARIFNQNIGGWNTAKVSSMQAMFYSEDSSGTSQTVFNQDISGWNVSKVTHIGSMFRYAKFNQNISGWDVSKVSTFSSYGLSSLHSDPVFQDSNQYYFTINKIPVPANSIQTAVNNWYNGGYGVNTAQYGKHISEWDVSQVTDMEELFKDKSSFNDDISSWNVSNVTSMNLNV